MRTSHGSMTAVDAADANLSQVDAVVARDKAHKEAQTGHAWGLTLASVPIYLCQI